ncbi:hypothetical protein [Pseudomonas cerasi]
MFYKLNEVDMILDEERAKLVAFEIGFAVLNLIKDERSVNSENICELLEHKRRSMENVLHRFVLKGTAELVRKGF